MDALFLLKKKKLYPCLFGRLKKNVYLGASSIHCTVIYLFIYFRKQRSIYFCLVLNNKTIIILNKYNNPCWNIYLRNKLNRRRGMLYIYYKKQQFT